MCLCTKRGREELPHVRGRQPRGVTPRPRSGGSGREYQTATAQERRRGATPCPRSGGAAEKSYPASEARGGGREDQPHVQGAVAVRAGGPRVAIPC